MGDYWRAEEVRKVEERGSKERAKDNSRAFMRGAGMERRYDKARGQDSRALRGKVVEERKRYYTIQVV